MKNISKISELAELIDENKDARVVGIVGAPGSGKSTITASLSESLRRENMVIPMDGFHYSQAKLRELGRRDRMGAPDTFDAQELTQKLGAVVKRESDVSFPDFDRTIEERIVPDSIVVPKSIDLILLEGNYLLYQEDGWQDLASLLDLSIYVEIAEATRLKRLLERHVKFGKTPEFAKEWIAKVDNPNAEKILSSKPLADIVFDYN